MNISRDGSLVLDDVKYVDDHSVRRIVTGDVLFNNTNSPPLVGKTAYVSVREPLAFSNHMTRLRVHGDAIDARFLARQMYSLWCEGYFQRICSNHVNQASVATKRLLETVVAVPPLDEQRRIVAVLEDHLSRLDAAEESLAHAERRTEIALTSWINGQVAAVNAEPMKLGDVTRSASYGTSTKCAYEGGGDSVVRIPNLVDGRIDMTDEKRAVDLRVDLARYKLKEGDLLFIRTNGSRELIGRTAVVDRSVQAAFASYLIRFQLDTARVRPRWVSLVSRTSALRRAIEGHAASSAGQYNLNLATLKGLAFPLPPAEVQDRIVDELTEIERELNRTRSVLGMVRLRSALLRRSLLAAAFSGQLT